MLKHPFSPIEKGRIRLCLLRESDLPMTLKWRNQDHIRKWFVHSGVLTPEQHREWFRGYLQRDNDYLFIIEEILDLKKAVGQISLYNIDWARKQGEYGRLMIGEAAAQGRGLAKETTGLLLHYAFKELGLNRVDLEVFKDNEPALSIYRAYGFKEIFEEAGLKKFILDEKTFWSIWDKK
jgi:RimJ/RimL family protein N-acetyltransferase